MYLSSRLFVLCQENFAVITGPNFSNYIVMVIDSNISELNFTNLVDGISRTLESTKETCCRHDLYWRVNPDWQVRNKMTVFLVWLELHLNGMSGIWKKWIALLTSAETDESSGGLCISWKMIVNLLEARKWYNNYYMHQTCDTDTDRLPFPSWIQSICLSCTLRPTKKKWWIRDGRWENDKMERW